MKRELYLFIQLASALLLGLFVFCKCSSKQPERKIDNNIFYEVRVNPRDKYDTLFNSTINLIPDENDSLEYEIGLVYENAKYNIKKYSNYQTSGMDGEYSYYYINDFGVIYFTSITWHSYSYLGNSNDSINRILDACFKEIVWKETYKSLLYFRDVAPNKSLPEDIYFGPAAHSTKSSSKGIPISPN